MQVCADFREAMAPDRRNGGSPPLRASAPPKPQPGAGLVRRCILAGSLAAVALLQAACASLGDSTDSAAYDTIEGFNRASYKFSDKVDRDLVAPAARAYQSVLPDPVEQGASNFFANLASIDSSINGFLQGKPKGGGTDLMRFLLNSTLGVAGLFDVATPAGLPAQNEDFGQTLAVWGWRNSRYVYVPLVGPSTIRDIPAMAFGAVLTQRLFPKDYRLWVAGVGLLSARANALALTDARDAAALDPYVFTREAYYQRRDFMIHDGEPPLDDFDGFFDEADAAE